VTWSGSHVVTVVATFSVAALGAIREVFVGARTSTGLGSPAQPGSITITLNGSLAYHNSWWALRTGGVRQSKVAGPTN
jgi:hypothetical protein